MAEDALLEPEAVDALLETSDLEGARRALLGVAPGDERYAVVRIKLALLEGSLASGAAMQSLIQLMRRNADWPGAKLCTNERRRQRSRRESRPCRTRIPRRA